jgi:Leucine-rich repeat (LRR) protein
MYMARRNILEIIEEAVKNKTEKLDLSDNHLIALPPEIGKLTNLKELFYLGINSQSFHLKS